MKALSGLESIRNIHAGRLAIIAGAGPSLRHLQPEQAEKHIMLAVNSAIIKFPKAPYFFSCDPGVTLQRSWELIKTLTCKILIGRPKGPEGFGAYDSKTGGRYIDGAEDRFIHIIRKPDEYSFAFHPNDQHIVFGHSSAHCACHTAFLMGCSPIVLVGCDCGVEDGKRYYYDFPGQEQYADDVAKEENKKLFARVDTPILSSFINYWDRIGSDNPNVQILNCSNAVIPNIQPAKLEDVLRQYAR